MAIKKLNLSDIIAKYKDPLIGGKGDNLSPDLVQKGELIVGIYVEMEHTKNPMVAISIALDHLSENKNYYSDYYNDDMIDEPKALQAAKKYFKGVTTKFEFAKAVNPWSEKDL